jgi:hypothetical protein
MAISLQHWYCVVHFVQPKHHVNINVLSASELGKFIEHECQEFAGSVMMVDLKNSYNEERMDWLGPTLEINNKKLSLKT